MTNALLAKSERLHVECCFDEVRNVFYDDFPGDIETTEGAPFDDVAWVVGFSRIDGESFVV